MHYDVCSTVSAAPTTELEQGCAQNGEAAYIQLKCPVGSVITGSSKRLLRQFILFISIPLLTWNHPDSIETSGQHRNRPYSIETAWTVSKCPDSIETVRTLLKQSGQSWNRPDSIETARTILKPSGQYWNSMNSIETVQTVSRLSDSVETVRTVSIPSGQYQNCPETNSLKHNLYSVTTRNFKAVVFSFGKKAWIDQNLPSSPIVQSTMVQSCWGVTWQLELKAGIPLCKGWIVAT